MLVSSVKPQNGFGLLTAATRSTHTTPAVAS